MVDPITYKLTNNPTTWILNRVKFQTMCNNYNCHNVHYIIDIVYPFFHFALVNLCHFSIWSNSWEVKREKYGVVDRISNDIHDRFVFEKVRIPPGTDKFRLILTIQIIRYMLKNRSPKDN